MHENTPEHLRNAMRSIDSLGYEVPKSVTGKLPHDPPLKAPPRRFQIRDRTFPDEDYEYMPNTQVAGNKDSLCSGWRAFWIIITILNILVLVAILALYLALGVPGSSATPESSRKYAHFVRDSSKCSEGYSWFEETGFCYRVSVTASSYDRAAKECYSEGGHVASIHSPDENDFAVNLYKSTLAEYRSEVDILHKRADLWIGLVYNKDSWGWSDGTTLNYTNWAENEPNRLDTGEFCTHIGLDEIAGYNPDGDKWNNIGSTYQAAYICKKKSS